MFVEEHKFKTKLLPLLPHPFNLLSSVCKWSTVFIKHSFTWVPLFCSLWANLSGFSTKRGGETPHTATTFSSADCSSPSWNESLADLTETSKFVFYTLVLFKCWNHSVIYTLDNLGFPPPSCCYTSQQTDPTEPETLSSQTRAEHPPSSSTSSLDLAYGFLILFHLLLLMPFSGGELVLDPD